MSEGAGLVEVEGTGKGYGGNGTGTLEKKEAKYRTESMNDEPKKFSPIYLDSYDQGRHLLLADSYNLIESQGDPGLNKERLLEVIRNKEIEVYEFDGEKYLDRLDIGRVYHQPKEPEGLTIERFFTKKGEDPFNSVKYSLRHLEIKEFETKKVRFNMDGAEIPEWMNDTDASIVADKYFFKPNKPEWKGKLKNKIGSEHEFSLKHLNKRVADFFTEEGDRLGYFKTEEDRESFRDELSFLQINGAVAFNSPTQFNAGIFNSYGIIGSKGINYWKDPKTGEIKRVKNGEYLHPQLHACFINGPSDDLENILYHTVDEGAIFASGSGIGQNIGRLREEGGRLSGGGKASGPKSFLAGYDKGAGTIKSGGKTRRAARMTDMDNTHPDIMEFIRMKVREDLKALSLIKAGFSAGMDGEAYSTVSFQNTNLSVRLNDKFFEALKNGKEIELYGVNDKKIKGKVSAERMLKEIAFGSWRIGDPGVQYSSKIEEMNTCKNSGEIWASNPCSEYLFLDDTSCSLFSARLTYFMNKDDSFNAEKFKHALRICTIAQNIANRAASYPVKRIAQISTEFDTIGAGYADLGSLLMRKGIPYDSDKGRVLAAAVTSLLTGTTYETSAEIAKARGAFTHFEFNKKPMLEVIDKHRKSLEGILWNQVEDDKLKEATYKSWDNAYAEIEKYGSANAQASVIAPTGTTSFAMGCSTTSAEPALSLIIQKNLAGGGNIMIVNKDTEISLRKLGYDEEQIKDVSRFILKNNTVRNAPYVKPEHYPIFDTAYGNLKGEGSIHINGHLKMLGAIQPFISGAISKTNNLPESATVKDIYDSYLLGDELGLKAVSVFRNNSKPSSALTLGAKSYKEFKRGEKEDLPPRRGAFESEVKIHSPLLKDTISFHMIVSEYENGKPGQIAFLSYKSGSVLRDLFANVGVQASKALKRGEHLEDIAEGWIGQEFEPKGFVSGHPYIKVALSPLDFAAKLLKLEYLGDTSVAQEPEKVNLRELRGFQNGAFRTYQREKVDEWNIEDVLKDPELGGFVEPSGQIFLANPNENGNRNARGKVCMGCGNLMNQVGPNCFQCTTCGDKIGGCGI